MRRLFALIGLSFCVTVPAIATPVYIGGGVEQFVWQEYDSGNSKLVKESGPLMFLTVEAENQVSDRWTYGFRGRIYSGAVDCEGQLKTGSTCADNDSDYDGASIAADFTGRFIRASGGYSDLGLRLGFAAEGWRRRLPGINGYSEEYFVASGKLGLAYAPAQGWFGEAGAKYPLSIDEEVNLYDDVSLSPQGAFSLYAGVGYNFNQRWAVKGYYDSYRFKASDPEPLTNGGALVGNVIQPESSMDRFGVTVGFYF